MGGGSSIGHGSEDLPPKNRMQFTFSKADKDTRWPKGFDPAAAGVTFA
jgi:hypothetical protein